MGHGGGGGGVGGTGAGAAIDQFVGVAASLEHADFTDGSRGTGNGADHFSHAKGRICRRCDREITARQPARRKGEDGWVHDTCPPDLT
ncbi:MAG TPA: hypothetical protein VHU92_25010 [Streptosporangiaceae bacterium]|jgi:hypothetical protein|nr:hypothetical protein [Streptosporangiaceae bacterium]